MLCFLKFFAAFFTDLQMHIHAHTLKSNDVIIDYTKKCRTKPIKSWWDTERKKREKREWKKRLRLTQREWISTPWMSPITVKWVALYTIHLSYGYTQYKIIDRLLSVFDNSGLKETRKNSMNRISYTKLNNSFEFICTNHMLFSISCFRFHSSTSLFALDQFMFSALCECVFALVSNKKKFKKIFIPFDLISRN